MVKGKCSSESNCGVVNVMWKCVCGGGLDVTDIWALEEDCCCCWELSERSLWWIRIAKNNMDCHVWRCCWVIDFWLCMMD